ncbi:MULTISPECIES: preprotein translocase subunit YajC [unclassified Nocardioides]|uniref:preprotein translocase subunit YajC n=1 Tax=unclassified Nocardioides TaxID=2615069 RepID=UPI000702F3D3|nr:MULTISPECIES: preprotein translocase subunit YajC [unclassified Nocardioides]KQP67004.1 preprotein translocase subunit YajC [Nocardioides sp. Leaf285]KQQ41326.1 preprotein translocase subunit YajC [Nocardioides sp. Leaf307]
MSTLVNLLPIILIALVFWLLIIRPQTRRQKELVRMQGSLTVGDRVMLTSGVFGEVREITDEHVGVEIADGVVIRVVRGAIGSIIPAHDPLEDPTDGPALGEGRAETEER